MSEKRILIVEDDPQWAKRIADAIQDGGGKRRL